MEEDEPDAVESKRRSRVGFCGRREDTAKVYGTFGPFKTNDRASHLARVSWWVTMRGACDALP